MGNGRSRPRSAARAIQLSYGRVYALYNVYLKQGHVCVGMFVTYSVQLVRFYTIPPGIGKEPHGVSQCRPFAASRHSDEPVDPRAECWSRPGISGVWKTRDNFGVLRKEITHIFHIGIEPNQLSTVVVVGTRKCSHMHVIKQIDTFLCERLCVCVWGLGGGGGHAPAALARFVHIVL